MFDSPNFDRDFDDTLPLLRWPYALTISALIAFVSFAQPALAQVGDLLIVGEQGVTLRLEGGQGSLDIPVRAPLSVEETAEYTTHYAADAERCGTETSYDPEVCGPGAIVCEGGLITDGDRCGWGQVSYPCGFGDTCTYSYPLSCVDMSCRPQCEVPLSCAIDGRVERTATVPDVLFGRIQGSFSVADGADEPAADLEFCPVGYPCRPFEPSAFAVEQGTFTLCGLIPGVGPHCLGLCDLPGAGDLCPAQAHDAIAVPTGVPVHLTAADAELSLTDRGGDTARTGLSDCLRAEDDRPCQWIFEASPTRPGAYYIRSATTGQPLVTGGQGYWLAGVRVAECETWRDRGSCQWYVQRSPSREGAIYLKSARTGTYLHTRGGTVARFEQTMHPCPKANDLGNCQWRILQYDTYPVPIDRPVRIQASDVDLAMFADGFGAGAMERLARCRTDENDPRCQWVFERSPTRDGAYYIKGFGSNLYLRSSWGPNYGSDHHLSDCNKAFDLSGCQWYVERSPTRLGAIYLRSAGAGLYLHTHGGSQPGYRQTLHDCPRGNDHPNCQWHVSLSESVTFVEDIPTHRPVNLRAADNGLAIQATGGVRYGATEALADCPPGADAPHCQWVFEPSPTRPGAFYIRTRDTDLYLHSHGGPIPGAHHTLHRCERERNHIDCQWYLERSLTRPGAFYVRSAGANLYLKTDGGSHAGHLQRLGACSKDEDPGDCQWRLLEPDLVPTDRPLNIRASDAELGVQIGERHLAELADCWADWNHTSCMFTFERSPTRPGAYYIKNTATHQYLHSHGGSVPDADTELYSCPKDQDHPNCQWYIERSLSRDALYFRSAGANLYLHTRGGSAPSNKLSLHPCDRDRDAGNCQWTVAPAHLNDPSVPPAQSVSIRPVAADLAVKTSGPHAGNVARIESCPIDESPGNCRWIFEPSPTRPGAWYIKSADASVYLHSSGGAFPGAQHTMHTCDKGHDYPNCQWYIEASPTRDGAVYLRSAGGDLYLQTDGGSVPGTRPTLSACPQHEDRTNCQWMLTRPTPYSLP